jgi:hypothetical protein
MSTHPKRIVLAWGSAALLAASPVGAAPSVSSSPAPADPTPAPPAAEPPATAPNPAAVDAAPSVAQPAAVGSARGTIERGMTELGTLLTRARQSGDIVRVACVQDKRDRAEVVLEVATGEILVLQDPGVDGQSRAFAGEKLSEAADNLSGLVDQARACQGGNDDGQRASQNEANQPKTVMPNDPTSSSPGSPRLPPRIDPRPPVASPVL